MKNLYATVIFFGIALLNSSILFASSAERFPEGFGSFYQFTNEEVSFRDINENFAMLPLRVNYNTIKLTDSELHKQQVYQALVKSQLTPSALDGIMADLALGVNTDFACDKPDILDCLVMPETYQFIFDYDNKLLLLFVNPDLLNENSQLKQLLTYQRPEDKNAALINHFSIYSSKSNNQDVNVRIDDEIVVGLPFGYVHGDAQYDVNEGDLDVYKMAYYLDYQNFQMRMGQFRSYDSLNATDFLRNNSSINNVRERVIEVASSNKLLLGKKNQQKSLAYFAPTSGRIVVRNTTNDRIIFSGNTKQGQQQLSYAELPYGIYDVVVEITSGSSVVSRERFTVFNQSNDTLSKGEFDFSLAAGTLEGSSIYDKDDKQDEIGFARGLAASKVSDHATVGLGVTGSELGGIALLGTSLLLPFDSQLELAYNHATTGEQYLNSTLQFTSFSVSYQKLIGSDQDNLASTLFGYGDYERLYVGTSFPIADSSYGRLSGSYSNNNNVTYNSDYENVNVTAGLSTQLNSHIRLDFNVGYTDDLTDNSRAFEDRLSASISMNIDLDPESGLSYNSMITGDNDGVNTFRNTLTANRLIETDNFNAYGQVGNNYSRTSSGNSSTTDASVSGQYDNKRVSGSAYTSYDSDDNYGVSADLSSTQVVTNNKVYFTSEKSQSYGLVDIATNSSSVKNSDDLKGYLTVRRTNSGSVKKNYIHGTKELIRLTPYDNYQMDLNTDIADLYNTGDKYVVGYAHPGSVVKVNASVGKAKRIVAGFTDIFNQPISSLSCQGEGCIEMNSVVDGVYNLTIIDELPYTLKSDEQLICQLNVINNDKVNYGNNYCFPDLKIGQKKELKDSNGDKKIVQHLGVFHPDTDVLNVIDDLQDSHVKVYLAEGQYLSSVYIVYSDETLITMRQNRTIDSLLQYAANTKPVDVSLNK